MHCVVSLLFPEQLHQRFFLPPFIHFRDLVFQPDPRLMLQSVQLLLSSSSMKPTGTLPQRTEQSHGHEGHHSPSEAFDLARTIESFISGVNSVWVGQNERHLNDDKKEIFPTGSAPDIHLPSSLCVGQSDSPCSSGVRNLGVVFDSQLALKEQVNKLSTLLAWRSGGWVQFDSVLLKPSNFRCP